MSHERESKKEHFRMLLNLQQFINFEFWLWMTHKMHDLSVISFRRELSVVYSFRMCCKILCQNLLVHPKCTLGGSTKFHAFHVLPTHPPSTPPPPQKWKFQLRTWLWNFEVTFWKLATNPLPPPPPLLTWEFGILAFLDSAFAHYIYQDIFTIVCN